MMLALGYLAGRDAFGHGRQLFGAALFLLLAVLIPCVAFSTYRRGGRRGMHRVALRRRTAMTTLGMVYTSAIIVAVVTTYSAQPLLH